MPELVASCHCGQATLRLAYAPDSITRCNCSLCSKSGFLGIYYPSDAVRITGEFESYVREDIGEAFLRILRCAKCGIATHWEPLSPPPHERMGVNARLIDPEVLKASPVVDVNGASW